MMTAKEYLAQYRESSADMKAAIEHIRDLREMCENLKGTAGESIRLDEAVARLIDAKEETAKELDRYCAIRADIRRTISYVRDVRYRELLHARYIMGLSWHRVAERIHFDYSYTVHTLHPAALRAVDVVLMQKR